MDFLVLCFQTIEIFDEDIEFIHVFVRAASQRDLQLAAELGKTLLERNKELETLVKELRSTIDEQQQEIVYLKKHTTALREVNDTRLKVYEQLDIGIQELERANQRLTAENASDKKHIKTLVQNIEALETRQEELTKQVDELRQTLSAERRKNKRLSSEKQNGEADKTDDGARLRGNEEQSTNSGQAGNENSVPENSSFAFHSTAILNNNANSMSLSTDNSLALSDMVCSGEENEEIIKLINDLENTKKAFVAEQQRCAELEDQLVAIIQENQTLHTRLANTSPNEELHSMQDELSGLDEVRQGKMCIRCLRVVEERGTIADEQSSLAPTEECDEDEERSLLDNASECSQAAAGYRTGAVSIKVSSRVPDSLDLNIPGSPNPYRDLVEKYEALLEVQCSAIARKNICAIGSAVSTGGGMSLAEEFQSSGEFSQSQKSLTNSTNATADSKQFANAANDSLNAKEDDANENGNANSIDESNASMNYNSNASVSSNKLSNASTSNAKDMRGRTPTEFSEAETSSSGYVDETSNKFTQTENRPGSFLCTIDDGEVCKFSIYDDASPIDSHFRNRPEYKELFKEIFAVLKKAAASKEEGEKLPLLDDTQPLAAGAICPSSNINNAGNSQNSKVPPVTPANEELPPLDFGDDTQSIISSAVSEQSFAMSECITKMERKTAKKHIIEKNQENQPPLVVGSTTLSSLGATTKSQIVENGRILTPLKREPLEYLSVGVGIKKKNRRKNRNFSSDRAESPATLPSPPRFFIASGKKRRDVRPYVQSPLANTTSSVTPETGRAGGRPVYEWNGSSIIIYNRRHNTSGASGSSTLGASGSSNSGPMELEYRPSFLSMELDQLKKLDMSYAEVLRSADSCKHKHCQAAHHFHQYQQLQQQQTPKSHKQQKQHRNRKN